MLRKNGRKICGKENLNNKTCSASATPPPRGARARCGSAALCRTSVSFAFAMILVAVSGVFAQMGPLTLDQCIDMAMNANPNLEIATERLNERDAAIEEANASRMPRLSASAGYTYLIPGITGVLEGTQPFTIGVNPVGDPELGGLLPLVTRDIDYKVSPHVWNADITASYVLYSGGRIRNAQNIARTSRTAAEWQRQSVVRELRRDVTLAFYQALSVSKNVVALDSAIVLMEVTLRDMRNMVEFGMLGEHEVLLVEVELSNLRLARRQVETGARAAHDYLATLIGVPVNTELLLANELQAPIQFVMQDLPILQTRARDASSDIKALEEQLKVVEMAIEINDAANLPTIVAAAGYRGSHQGRVIEPQKADWEWDNQAFVSLQAQWDIWDGNARRHRRGQSRSQMRQLQLTIDNIQTMLDMGVKVSAANLQDAYDAIEVNRQSIESAKRSYEIAADRFREGIIPSSELLRAQNSVLQSEVAYYGALSTFYSRLADLEYLINE